MMELLENPQWQVAGKIDQINGISSPSTSNNIIENKIDLVIFAGNLLRSSFWLVSSYYIIDISNTILSKLLR
jgi:hypothetical protein